MDVDPENSQDATSYQTPPSSPHNGSGDHTNQVPVQGDHTVVDMTLDDPTVVTAVKRSSPQPAVNAKDNKGNPLSHVSMDYLSCLDLTLKS